MTIRYYYYYSYYLFCSCMEWVQASAHPSWEGFHEAVTALAPKMAVNNATAMRAQAGVEIPHLGISCWMETTRLAEKDLAFTENLVILCRSWFVSVAIYQTDPYYRAKTSLDGEFHAIGEIISVVRSFLQVKNGHRMQSSLSDHQCIAQWTKIYCMHLRWPFPKIYWM